HCWHSICQAHHLPGTDSAGDRLRQHSVVFLAHSMKLTIKSVDWSKRAPVILLAAGICGVAVAAMPMIKTTLTLPKEEPAKSETAKESVPAAGLGPDGKGAAGPPPRPRG